MIADCNSEKQFDCQKGFGVHLKIAYSCVTEVLVAPLETSLKVDWQNDTDADHHDNESEGNQVALKLQILNGVAAALLKILLVTEK